MLHVSCSGWLGGGGAIVDAADVQHCSQQGFCVVVRLLAGSIRDLS